MKALLRTVLNAAVLPLLPAGVFLAVSGIHPAVYGFACFVLGVNTTRRAFLMVGIVLIAVSIGALGFSQLMAPRVGKAETWQSLAKTVEEAQRNRREK